MSVHEYSLLNGVNRALVGRYIGTVSAAVSSLIVFLLLSLVDVAEKFGLPLSIPPTILSLVGAGAVFAVLYWVFDSYIWRWSPIGALLKIPNLSGSWECRGKSLDETGGVKLEWVGSVVILQSWDRISVRVNTDNSYSLSIIAALQYDKAEGYQLIYNYRNYPKIHRPELRGHLGFANVKFALDQQTARGEYFNGNGRFTFGTMEWERA